MAGSRARSLLSAPLSRNTGADRDGGGDGGGQFSAFQSELFEENYTILRNNY